MGSREEGFALSTKPQSSTAQLFCASSLAGRSKSLEKWSRFPRTPTPTPLSCCEDGIHSRARELIAGRRFTRRVHMWGAHDYQHSPYQACTYLMTQMNLKRCRLCDKNICRFSGAPDCRVFLIT